MHNVMVWFGYRVTNLNRTGQGALAQLSGANKHTSAVNSLVFPGGPPAQY